MIRNLPDFAQFHVTVFGDVMLDRYWYGDANRISPEAPVQVVHVNQVEDRPGGAGNVALNISSLGGKVGLFSLCGEDGAADVLEHKLQAALVDTHFQRIQHMVTITKLRVICLHQQLLRLDFEDHTPAFSNQELIHRCINSLAATNVLIISDYGKGGAKNCQELINAARKQGVPVLVDPKSKDFTIYKGATLITPNMLEFEAVVGECPTEEDIISKGQDLIERCEIEGLLITRGAKGMTLLQKAQLPLHLPTRAREVYDVTGAGDTVIGVLAISLAAGLSLAEAMQLANLAAGLVVGRLGAASVTVPELKRALSGNTSSTGSMLNEDQLLALVKDVQDKGEKVVMTNGCFDILHSGHVMYLEQAKALGDRLIVAVNDDESVKRLKGADRPINSLERRMAVLAGLSAVDWVVSFSEDTPERLICKILPDVLVKGGDWKVDQIAGSHCVLKNGGAVKVLGFEEGISTSEIVNKIKTKKGG